ncbi:MAG: hypothetical protein Q9227_007708 [Pyrenula ochraceoflavens]
MLHEILLSLFGFESPLLQHANNSKAEESEQSNFPLLSPPEKALLAKLAHLSNLHLQIKDQTANIAAAHDSTICQVVSSSIASKHLGHFRTKILEVEKQILAKDASHVGGYGIVPLSTVVGEFEPWTKRLEWLLGVTKCIAPVQKGSMFSRESATGASLIKYLRYESRTGYQDIEEMALQLAETAEMAWLRQLSGWVLYGTLPRYGQRDFFIQQKVRPEQSTGSHANSFYLDETLTPVFVSSGAASSIFFVGGSLNKIRERDGARASNDPAMDLLPRHLDLLHKLKPPISQNTLETVISDIRKSISQNIFAHLLPLAEVKDVLKVLAEFLLLKNGEFAMALITLADKKIQGRNDNINVAKPVRKAGLLDGIILRDVELNSVLADTWAELDTSQKDEEFVNDVQEMARELLHFTTEQPSFFDSDNSAVPYPFSQCQQSLKRFHDLLFPSPAYLKIRVQPPQDLFLNDADLATYSLINLYLLSIQRAEMHLNGLWRHTQLRRWYPAPLGPPASSTRIGENSLLARRQRENSRALFMRRHWAAMSSTLYVLSALRGYFQGDIVEGSSQHFEAWLDHLQPLQGSPRTSQFMTSTSLTPITSPDAPKCNDFQDTKSGAREQPDPEALSKAHRYFLATLLSSLLLTSVEFCAALRVTLLHVEHFVALVVRLQRTQNNLDLEEDEGVVDSLTDHKAEEAKVAKELDRSRTELEESITALINQLKTIEEDQASHPGKLASQYSNSANAYQPFQGAGIERLLIKLDSLRGSQDMGGTDDSDFG